MGAGSFQVAAPAMPCSAPSHLPDDQARGPVLLVASDPTRLYCHRFQLAAVATTAGRPLTQGF